MAKIFNESIEGVKELIQVIEVLKKDLKELIVQSKKASESLEFKKSEDVANLEKEIKAVAKAESELLKVRQQEEKLNIQLEKLQQEQLKSLKAIRVAEEQREKVKRAEANTTKANINVLREQEKLQQDKVKTDILERKEKERLLKAQVKEEKEREKLNSAYSKASKELNELRKKYKDLRLEEGKTTKETEELRKEIQKLDKDLKDVDAEAGQFQRNVGNYPKVADKAKGAFGSLSGFLLGTLVGAFTKSREASLEFTIFLEQAGSIARTVVEGLVQLWENKLFPTLENLILKFKETGLEAKLFFQELIPESLRSDEQQKAIESLTKELKNLGDTIKENQELIDNSENPLSAENLKESRDAIAENIKEIRRLAIEERKLADFRDKTIIQIERLNQASEQAQILADDATLSFENQQKALEESLRLREDALALEEEIAQRELQLAIDRLNVNLREKDIALEVNQANVDRLKFLDNFDKAQKLEAENIDAVIEAVKRRNEIESQGVVARLEASKQEREIARDRFEQDLDFAIDVFDRQKTVNERIFQLETTNAKQKQRILLETEALTEKSFQNQIKLTENFIEKSLLSQGKSQKEVSEGLAKINLEQLVTLKDEEKVRARLLESGIVDEITQNRIREIILERKTVTQDLVDLQLELNDLLTESEEELLTFRAQTISQISEENTDARIKDFEEAEAFNQKKLDSAKAFLQVERDAKEEEIALETSIAIEKAKTSDEIIRLEEEEKEKLRQLNVEYYAEVEDLDKIANEKRVEDIKKTADKVGEILDALQEKQRERYKERIANIDDEIDASKTREEELKELAKQRIVNSDENLAFEQRKQAELEKEKEKEQQRQIRRELGFTALKTYSANVSNDPNTALTKTLSDITLLMAGISALNSFYDGTEDTGTSANPLDSKGGRLAVLHDNERVVPQSENVKMKGITNQELGSLAEAYKRGDLVESDRQLVSFNSGWQSNSEIITKFDELKNSIEALPNNMPIKDFKYNEVERAIVDMTKVRNKVVRNHKKQGGIW